MNKNIIKVCVLLLLVFLLFGCKSEMEIQIEGLELPQQNLTTDQVYYRCEGSLIACKNILQEITD
jgi:uncharacterized protein YcfL